MGLPIKQIKEYIKNYKLWKNGFAIIETYSHSLSPTLTIGFTT